ncbi:MAG: hypothetical protein ACXWCY_11665 [Burkholderiales bacterium]
MDALAHRLQWLHKQRRWWLDVMCLAEAGSASECWLIARFEVGLLEDLISEAEMDRTLLHLWRDLRAPRGPCPQYLS